MAWRGLTQESKHFCGYWGKTPAGKARWWLAYLFSAAPQLPEPDVTTLCDYFDENGERHGQAYSVMALRAALKAQAEPMLSARRSMTEALKKCKTCALPTEVRDLVDAALRPNVLVTAPAKAQP